MPQVLSAAILRFFPRGSSRCTCQDHTLLGQSSERFRVRCVVAERRSMTSLALRFGSHVCHLHTVHLTFYGGSYLGNMSFLVRVSVLSIFQGHRVCHGVGVVV
jgi:hypothetical protein